MIVGMVLVAGLVSAALAETTPAQYETGTRWEAALADSPEVGLLGSTAVASWNGNVYILQGNTLRKLTSDLREVASVQVADLPLVMASLDSTRGEIACGMNETDLSGRMQSTMNGPATAYVPAQPSPPVQQPASVNQFGSTTANNWQTASAPAAGFCPRPSEANLAQGLHEAHTLGSLAAAHLSADARGVCLLRGGRLTVFDPDLREVKSQQVLSTVSTAADCPLCRSMLSDGVAMDQARYLGMRNGLCVGPGQYAGTVYAGDTSRERMASRRNGWTCPTCGQPAQPTVTAQPSDLTREVPASITIPAPIVPAPGPGPSVDSGATLINPAYGSRYGNASAGSPEQWQAMQESLAPRGARYLGNVVGATGATSPSVVGPPHAGTALLPGRTTAEQGGAGTEPGLAQAPGTATQAQSARADQGGPGTTPGTTGAARAGTAVVASGTRATAPDYGTSSMSGTTGGVGRTAPPAGSSYPGVITETGLQTVAPGRYDWMYDLPDVGSGQTVMLATRNVTNGSVLFGVSGSKAGPQFLDVNVLQPNGALDPTATISAYIYNRGSVDLGRSLNLIRRGGGDYMIRFDPTQAQGDTLAVRVMRPGAQDQIVFFSLLGSEMTPR